MGFESYLNLLILPAWSQGLHVLHLPLQVFQSPLGQVKTLGQQRLCLWVPTVPPQVIEPIWHHTQKISHYRQPRVQKPRFAQPDRSIPPRDGKSHHHTSLILTEPKLMGNLWTEVESKAEDAFHPITQAMCLNNGGAKQRGCAQVQER